VPFSHKHHSGELGIDCRSCHQQVEALATAGLPPTHTCMTYYSEIWAGSPMLAPVRDSLANNEPLHWTRVNRLRNMQWKPPADQATAGAALVKDCHIAGPERRSFLKLMAASFMLAGLSGCDDPSDGRGQEVPYVRAPERMEPGVSLQYALLVLLDGFANGVLVTTRNGRPLKIEGNPEHPWSRGGTDVQGQASVLGLYDPNRSQSVQHLGCGRDRRIADRRAGAPSARPVACAVAGRRG